MFHEDLRGSDFSRHSRRAVGADRIWHGRTWSAWSASSGEHVLRLDRCSKVVEGRQAARLHRGTGVLRSLPANCFSRSASSLATQLRPVDESFGQTAAQGLHRLRSRATGEIVQRCSRGHLLAPSADSKPFAVGMTAAATTTGCAAVCGGVVSHSGCEPSA